MSVQENTYYSFAVFKKLNLCNKYFHSLYLVKGFFKKYVTKMSIAVVV